MDEQKILNFAKESIFDRVKYLGKWNGFDVWEAAFSDNVPRYTGFPQFILVKDENLRWSDDDEESIKIMNKLWLKQS